MPSAEYQRAWRKAHPENVKRYTKNQKVYREQWGLLNPDKIRKNVQKTRAKYRKRILECRKEYYKNHPKKHPTPEMMHLLKLKQNRFCLKLLAQGTTPYREWQLKMVNCKSFLMRLDGISYTYANKKIDDSIDAKYLEKLLPMIEICRQMTVKWIKEYNRKHGKNISTKTNKIYVKKPKQYVPNPFYEKKVEDMLQEKQEGELK